MSMLLTVFGKVFLFKWYEEVMKTCFEVDFFDFQVDPENFKKQNIP